MKVVSPKLTTRTHCVNSHWSMLKVNGQILKSKW